MLVNSVEKTKLKTLFLILFFNILIFFELNGIFIIDSKLTKYF